MTRTQNVKKNLIFNVVKYVASLVLQFILRTVLIYYMGAEYLGLNGLFTNIFTFLNLTELGIGSAIVFSMYKPIADGDIEKVKSLQNLYKKIYIVIAIIVGTIGLGLTPFITFFMGGGTSIDINIYVLYIMFLVSMLVGYFSAHKRSLLFAYQRSDVENKVGTICTFLRTAIQAVVLIIFKNYYAYLSITIVFTLAENIAIQVVANKMFPEINGPAPQIDKETKKEITKNVTALSMHKIGGAVVFSTDNILVSTFFGLAILGVYSNYALITTTLGSFFALFISALQASVGNLIASSDTEYVFERYKKIRFVFSYLTAMTTICLFVLVQPFILKWTGSSEYLLELPVVLSICLSYYLTRIRTPVGLFKDAAGLFWQDRWKPIIEAAVNFGVSIGLAFLMGINGIFLGTIASSLAAPIWIEPCVLYKHYFKKSPKKYFLRLLLDFAIMLACGAACYYTCALIPDGGIWLLILKFGICFLLSNALLILAYLPTGDLIPSLQYFKNAILSHSPKKEK